MVHKYEAHGPRIGSCAGALNFEEVPAHPEPSAQDAGPSVACPPSLMDRIEPMMAMEPVQAPSNPVTYSPALKVGKVVSTSSNAVAIEDTGPDVGKSKDGITLAHIFEKSGHTGAPLSQLKSRNAKRVRAYQVLVLLAGRHRENPGKEFEVLIRDIMGGVLTYFNRQELLDIVFDSLSQAEISEFRTRLAMQPALSPSAPVMGASPLQYTVLFLLSGSSYQQWDRLSKLLNKLTELVCGGRGLSLPSKSALQRHVRKTRRQICPDDAVAALSTEESDPKEMKEAVYLTKARALLASKIEGAFQQQRTHSPNSPAPVLNEVHTIVSGDGFGVKDFHGRSVNHEQGILKVALPPEFGLPWNSLQTVLPAMFATLPESRANVELLWSRFAKHAPHRIQVMLDGNVQNLAVKYSACFDGKLLWIQIGHLGQSATWRCFRCVQDTTMEQFICHKDVQACSAEPNEQMLVSTKLFTKAEAINAGLMPSSTAAGACVPPGTPPPLQLLELPVGPPPALRTCRQGCHNRPLTEKLKPNVYHDNHCPKIQSTIGSMLYTPLKAVVSSHAKQPIAQEAKLVDYLHMLETSPPVRSALFRASFVDEMLEKRLYNQDMFQDMLEDDCKVLADCPALQLIQDGVMDQLEQEYLEALLEGGLSAAAPYRSKVLAASEAIQEMTYQWLPSLTYVLQDRRPRHRVSEGWVVGRFLQPCKYVVSRGELHPLACRHASGLVKDWASCILGILQLCTCVRAASQ